MTTPEYPQVSSVRVPTEWCREPTVRRPAPDWQPAETAPKTTEPFLAFTGNEPYAWAAKYGPQSTWLELVQWDIERSRFCRNHDVHAPVSFTHWHRLPCAAALAPTIQADK